MSTTFPGMGDHIPQVVLLGRFPVLYPLLHYLLTYFWVERHKNTTRSDTTPMINHSITRMLESQLSAHAPAGFILKKEIKLYAVPLPLGGSNLAANGLADVKTICFVTKNH